MPLACAWALLGPIGCLDGPSPVPSYPSPGAGYSGSSSSETSGSSDSSDSSSSTTAADETGTDPTGVVFLIAPDMGPAFLCDLFLQDCPPGEKCTSWANNGGSAWNATKCVPVVDDPAGVGEPCHMEGSPTSGIDDCDHGSMCFYVDHETLEGTCTPFCMGDESNPHCEDPARYCPVYGDSALLLCISRCSPIEQDCPAGQACYPIQDDWSCAPDASGSLGAYGDPCEFINVCDPGLVCLNASAVPPGQACEGAAGCCTEICDITDPLGDLQCAGAAEGQTCQPWYEPGWAPPGYEDVGVCTVP